MKRVFESAECEEVRNSIFWELRYEKKKSLAVAEIADRAEYDAMNNDTLPCS